MVWKFLEIGFNFYFQVECLDGVERDKVHKTLHAIRNLDNPLEYEGVLTSCPQQERIIVRVASSDLFMGLIIHNDDDPKYSHCIELVKIINPTEINF